MSDMSLSDVSLSRLCVVLSCAVVLAVWAVSFFMILFCVCAFLSNGVKRRCRKKGNDILFGQDRPIRAYADVWELARNSRGVVAVAGCSVGGGGGGDG